MFEGEDTGIPEPSDPEELDQFQGGSWAFIDIDTTKLNTAKERVNISVPAFALREIDDYIGRVGENRSHFLYTTALKVIRGQLSEKVQVKVPRQYKAAPAKKKVAVKKKAASK